MPDPCLTEFGWTGSALRVAGRVERDATRAPIPEIDLLLRERDGCRVLRIPASVTARAGSIGFEAAVDVASVDGGRPLPGGLWDVDVAVGWATRSVVLPLGRDRAPTVDSAPRRRFLPGSVAVAAYFAFEGGLAIDVGGRPHAAGCTTADLLAWDERAERVAVTGHLDLRRITMPVSGTLHLVERRTRRRYQVFATLEERAGALGYRAGVPVTRAFTDDPLPRGAWDVTLRLGFSGMRRELRVLAPGSAVDVRVWRRLRHVRVVSTVAPDPLTITVGRG